MKRRDGKCLPPAFTLMELLTAMAVLALILVLLLQVVDGIMQSTGTQNRKLNSGAAARRTLEVLTADLSQAVIDENTAILTNLTNSGLAFLTDRRGPVSAAGHRYLAVTYELSDNKIVRFYRSVDFSKADLLSANVVIADDHAESSVLADGILGFQIQVTSDLGDQDSTDSGADWSTASYNQFAVPVGWRAIVTTSPSFTAQLDHSAHSLKIWIAAVDLQNLEILNDSGLLATAQSTFGSDPANWRNEMDASSLPARIKAATRILTKTITLR